VNEFLAGAGTDAPDVDEEEENITYRPSVTYEDMWAKTILEADEPDVMSNCQHILYFFYLGRRCYADACIIR
jgi:hypothetical protein